MTSSINPNNINGQYPIAGIDNDSQGFRDNFTNIRNNLAYAEEEITDLQTNVLLKGPLSGTDLNNDMLNAPLINAQIKGFTQTIKDHGPLSGSVPINFRDGHFQRVQTAGNITLAFSGWPTSGFFCNLRLWVQVTNVAHTLTLPLEVSVGIDNIAGISGNTITFPEVGTYIFKFSTYDAGSTLVIEDLLRNYGVFGSALAINGDMNVAGTLTTGGYEILPKETVTLSSVSSVITSYPATYQACFIDYVYVNVTGVATGTLTIANNGGLADLIDTGTVVGTPGISFTVAINGGNVEVTQNSVGAGDVSFVVRRM